MQIRDQLEQEARGVASWLEAHAEAFPALHIVRVDSAVATDDDGEWVIDLTVVLEDPTDPGQRMVGRCPLTALARG